MILLYLEDQGKSEKIQFTELSAKAFPSTLYRSSYFKKHDSLSKIYIWSRN